ncbi:MAG: hypothetical protein PUF68_02755, partial [Lactimicrobium massiliense]
MIAIPEYLLSRSFLQAATAASEKRHKKMPHLRHELSTSQPFQQSGRLAFSPSHINRLYLTKDASLSARIS